MNINISLYKIEWQMLRPYLENVVEVTHIDFAEIDYSMAACLITEIYQKHLTKLTFLKEKQKLCLSPAQAMAFMKMFKEMDDMVLNKIRAVIHQKLC